MADLNMKKTALQLLAINGILTQDEVDKCISAISEEDLCDGLELIPSPLHKETNVVFEDSRICVTYKGMRRVGNLFFGDGIEFKFVIHNKTNFEMRVSATDIAINGFVVANDELLCSEASPNRRTIDNFSLYSVLNDVDVSDTEDIFSLEMAISYEIEALDFEYESDVVEIDI